MEKVTFSKNALKIFTIKVMSISEHKTKAPLE